MALALFLKTLPMLDFFHENMPGKETSSHSFSDKSPESLEAATMLASRKKEDTFVSAEL